MLSIPPEQYESACEALVTLGLALAEAGSDR